MACNFGHQKHNHAAGSINLALDKPYYLGGEFINGTVDILLTQLVPNVQAVCLKFKGFERTLIENTVMERQGDNTKMVTHKYKDEKIFFNQNLVLYKIANNMPPGKYMYPFSYQLPPNLPGVFYDERKEFDGDKIRGAIVYKIKVFLDMPGKDLKYGQAVIVAEPVMRQIVPMKDHQEKGFLFASGKLKMDVAMDKNVFVPGEIIPIKVHVDNESSKVVNHCKVKLMRTIHVKAKHYHKSHTEEVCRQTYEGCGPKTKRDFILSFPFPAAQIYPSTHGNLVQCKYFLVIECDIPMAFDLESKPDILIALLPAPGQIINLYNNYMPKAW